MLPAFPTSRSSRRQSTSSIRPTSIWFFRSPRQHHKGVLAKRPIANAAWKSLDDQPGLYKSYAKTYHDRFERNWRSIPPNSASPGPNDWPQIALRFTISQPGVHCAIIGTTNPGNARTNVELIEKGPLPTDVVEKIQEAFHNADPGGLWTGQT